MRRCRCEHVREARAICQAWYQTCDVRRDGCSTPVACQCHPCRSEWPLGRPSTNIFGWSTLGPENNVFWYTLFRRKREDRITTYDRNGPPSGNNNSEEWRRCWSTHRRILAWVLGHIDNENNPPLTMPLMQPRLGAHRLQMLTSLCFLSSRSSSSRPATRRT
jgi:hypothetical protein